MKFLVPIVVIALTTATGCLENTVDHSPTPPKDAPTAQTEAIAKLNSTQVWANMSVGTLTNQLYNGYGSIGFQGMALIGDINGDGNSDVAVGSPSDGDPHTALRGKFFVYSGIDGSLIFSVGGDYDNDGFGTRVSFIGDADGDGTSDIASSSNQGRVYIYSGKTHARISRRIYDNNLTSRCLGYALAPAGDFNNDGHADLLVGDPCWNSRQGQVLVLSGTDLTTLQKITDSNGSQFGFRLTSDLETLPATFYITNRAQGTVSVFKDRQTTPAVVYSGQAWNFGDSLAVLGDLNKDGFSEVAILSSANETPKILSGISTQPLFELATQKIKGLDSLGGCVANIGDWNKDGIDDIAISQWESAKVYVFSGKEGSLLGAIEPPESTRGNSELVGAKNFDGKGIAGFLYSAHFASPILTLSGDIDMTKSGGKVHLIRPKY